MVRPMGAAGGATLRGSAMDKDAPPDPLAGLVDIPLPPEVSLWPQTWPLRIAIVVLAVALIGALWWLARRWWANRYRRAALAELDALPAPTQGALALLVRRTALSAFPRADVAALSDMAWLAFLDRTYGGTGFTQGPGRALAAGPYEPQPHDLPPEGEGGAERRKGDARSKSILRGEVESGPTSPIRPFGAPSPSGGRREDALLDLVRRWIRTHHA